MNHLRKQIIVTNINTEAVFAYMIGERIYDVLIEDTAKDVRVGDVYVGRVKNVIDNIRAAFVEFRPGVMGYLRLDERQRKSVRAEQTLLVQVKKPAVGTKDAVLTTRIELVGRFCIASCEDVCPSDTEADDGVSIRISRKIPDEACRKRLFDAVSDRLQAEYSSSPDGSVGMGRSVMIRTNAASADESIFLEELVRLNHRMDEICLHGMQRTDYSCLYREPSSYVRLINRYPSDAVDRIVTDDEDAYNELCDAFTDIPVERYEDADYPPDARYAISTTLDKALERRVWLKSGANIIIDRTEAMTVIDVNTAKAVQGNRASETTFFKINIEAATEVARQLRLRNLSGIILVDFIDMKEKDHIDELIAHLRMCLKMDPVKATYVDYTGLGLIEITRARHQASLYETWKADRVSTDGRQTL